MEEDVARILIHREEIERRLADMAEEIAQTYHRDEEGLTLIPVLAGSIIFLADLMRKLPLKMKIGLVSVSAYPGRTTRPTAPKTVIELTGDLAGRHVLIIDDILDTGRTLRKVREMVLQREPASVRTAVLLRKPSKAPPDVSADFVGFDIEDEFVVGCGLDYDDHYRNYPHIGVLRPEIM